MQLTIPLVSSIFLLTANLKDSVSILVVYFKSSELLKLLCLRALHWFCNYSDISGHWLNTVDWKALSFNFLSWHSTKADYATFSTGVYVVTVIFGFSLIICHVIVLISLTTTMTAIKGFNNYFGLYIATIVLGTSDVCRKRGVFIFFLALQILSYLFCKESYSRPGRWFSLLLSSDFYALIAQMLFPMG